MIILHTAAAGVHGQSVELDVTHFLAHEVVDHVGLGYLIFSSNADALDLLVPQESVRLLNLSMQNGKKSLSNSEKATAFAVALPLLMICCPWFRDKVYVLSIIRISIAATCARVALP